MEKQKMLVTQALNELKTLDSRINRAIANTTYIAAAKKNETKVSSNLTKTDFVANTKADMQSITDLIERRKRMKAAIVKSNAETKVVVGGTEMTVADAIERKTSISYETDLLNRMRYQLDQATKQVNVKNLEMENKIDSLVATAYGRDSKATIGTSDYDNIANPYKTNNEYSLVDPLNLKAVIDKLETDILTFTSEVDSVLQISNCVTSIEIE